MTTNKPEVVAWYYRHATREHLKRLMYRPMHKVGENYEEIELIRLSDYEALQAECEKLRKDADQYRRLIELGEDFHWENIIRVDISDFPSRADAIDAAMQETNP